MKEEKKDQENENEEKILKSVMKNYEIKLLGEPFAEIKMDRTIKRGWNWKGDKYYER